MVLPTGANHGLGFDMDDDRRQSNSDDSTLEIGTPTTANGPKGAYLDYGENVVVIPETIKEPSNIQPLSAAFQHSSADTSPASRHSGNEQDDDDGQSFLHACTYARLLTHRLHHPSRAYSPCCSNRYPTIIGYRRY